MAQQAQAELYLKLVASGVQESSKDLSGLARAAIDAGREFRLLQAAAQSGLYRALAREAKEATDQLDRMRRVAREGRLAVFASDLTTALAPLGRAGQAAFGALTASVGGFIAAGARGTAESMQLSRALTEINFQLASAFTPWITRGIDLVQRFADSMRNLTGETQAQIRQWVTGAAALSGFVSLLGGRGLPGVGRLPLVGGFLGGPAGGILALLGASQEGRAALMELARATVPLVQSFTGLVPIVAGLSSALGKVISFILSVPGVKGPGGLGPIGGLGLGAGVGFAVGGPLGALFGSLLGAAGAGIGGARAERIEAQTDLAELKRRLAQTEADIKGEALGPRGSPVRNIAESQAEMLRTRIAELEGQKAKAKEQLTPFTPGFESPADLYRRIAEVASGQRDPAERTATATEIASETLKAILDMFKGLGVNIPLDRPGDA
jgi:hypothetical protein